MSENGIARRAARRYLPAPVRKALRRRLAGPGAPPPVGGVRFGDLRRPGPIGGDFGYERGNPIDRHYIERFLFEDARRAGFDPVGGRVLELASDHYASQLARGRPIELDILDLEEANPAATIVDDLARPSQLRPQSYEYVICTQALHLIHDVGAAIATLERILAPGGTVLVTVPGISPIFRGDTGAVTDQWRFTSDSIRRLFARAFEPGEITVIAYGNVLAATAFLYGLCTADLDVTELDVRDPDVEMVLGVVARKPGDDGGGDG